jgi:hypothetical protein
MDEVATVLREQAERLRELSKRLREPDLRAEMYVLAARCDDLAEKIERPPSEDVRD